MKKNAFTLIEIMASLMVFAIGGTLALSVFNYTTANRIAMHEKNEAQLMASNILKTYMLKSITDPSNSDFSSGGEYWEYPSGHESGKGGDYVVPGHKFWKWNSIPVQVMTGSSAYSSPYTAANTFYTNYKDTASPKRSIFEYGFSISDVSNPDDNWLTIYRSEFNHEKDINDFRSFSEFNDTDFPQAKIFSVVVRWPLHDDDPTDDAREESKRVMVTGVLNNG